MPRANEISGPACKMFVKTKWEIIGRSLHQFIVLFRPGDESVRFVHIGAARDVLNRRITITPAEHIHRGY